MKDLFRFDSAIGRMVEDFNKTAHLLDGLGASAKLSVLLHDGLLGSLGSRDTLAASKYFKDFGVSAEALREMQGFDRTFADDGLAMGKQLAALNASFAATDEMTRGAREAMEKAAYFHSSAQSIIDMIGEMDRMSAAPDRLVWGLDRMHGLYERVYEEAEESETGSSHVAPSLIPQELFGQAALVETLVDEPDLERSKSARDVFAEGIRPQLRQILPIRYPRLAEGLAAADKAMAEQGPLWFNSVCGALRYAFDDAVAVFASDDDVRKWPPFYQKPRFRRKDGRPTWRARVHFIARYVDPNLTSFPAFVGASLKEIDESLDYLNSHCHPSKSAVSLIKMQTAQVRVEGVMMFMFLLSTPLES